MSKRTRLLNKLKHVYSHNTKLVLDVSNDDIGLIIEALETKIELNKRNLTPELILEYIRIADEWVKSGIDFDFHCKAVDKQIAKKPIHEATIQECHTCPNCKNILDRFDKTLYCMFCGQKLDWSEADD